MTSIRFLITRGLMALVFCAVAGQASYAETWPTRPITLVIGFAGGTGDTIGRPFADFAAKQLGQPVVVENRPAGGGVVAASGVAKSQPDGYTIGLQAVGPMIVRPIMDPTLGYDADKDFSPIALLIDAPNVIISGAKFPAHSVREMVDWAKQNPARLTVGHPGPGTMGHLAALLLASNADIVGNYISYRNVTLMVTDLLGGQIDVGVAAYNPQLKAARVLAVMTPEPVAFLPGVPSMRQAGFPGVYASTWFALYGPPNLSADIVAKLNAVANAFLHSEGAQKQFALLGVQALGGTPAQLTKRMNDDRILWSKVIKDAHIQLNK
jgi:tripartite-type tricarboxylate transporter receptor subunit TctC